MGWAGGGEFNVGLPLDIYRPISFKLVMTMDLTEFYVCISVRMNMTFIQGYSCVTNQKLRSFFRTFFNVFE